MKEKIVSIAVRFIGFIKKNQWLSIGVMTAVLIGSIIIKIVVDKNKTSEKFEEVVVEISPEPTPSTGSGSPTATPTPTPTPTTTSVSPTATLTPRPTNTVVPPSPTPTSQTQSYNFTLNHQASFTGAGSGNGQVTKNSNGFWDFSLNASFTNLSPNRNYQLWLCGNNCSSFTNAMFATDSSGAGSLSNTTITHNQIGDPLSRIAVWDMSVGTTDPNFCVMISNNSTPCLQSQFSF
jgi:hypothetical protein